MFRRFSIIAMAAAVLVLASCAKENLIGNGLGNDGLLKFGLSMSGSPTNVIETKASSMATEDGSLTLPLNYERCDGIESVMAGPETKGTQYNSAEEYTGAGNTTFSVVAWNGDGTPFFENATEVKYDSGRWSTETACQWDPKGDVKTFLAWANAPATGAVIGNALLEGEGRQTFSYTVPADARQQNDILLGWYKGNGGDSMTADITMVHPLTAIVFKKGEMDLSVSAIKSISIEGLLKTGEAEVTYAIVSEQVKPSYSWTMGSETQNVMLSRTGEAPSLEVDEETAVIGVPFIVLPQKVAANKVKLSVVLTIGGTDRTLTAYIPAMEMKEGQTNVFTIGYKLPYDDGSLPGEFSVGPNKKVRFSPGNLYYNGSIFVFEANQYDYRTYTGCISVINGVEGTTEYQDWGLMAWSTPENNWGLINYTKQTTITGDFKDWGQAVGDGKTWRTLSAEEMQYMLEHNKWGLATINTGSTFVKGTVIVPEGWTVPSGCSLTEGYNEGYSTNAYSLTQWQKMQDNGAVFFPATGYYYKQLGQNVNNSRVLLWSSTSTTDGTNWAYYLNAIENSVAVMSHERYYRIAVRLVTDVDKPDPSKVEFIDLGLPSGTLWANMNVGAKDVTDYGDHYPWGETELWYTAFNGLTFGMRDKYSGGFTSTQYSTSSNMKNVQADLTGDYAKYDVASEIYGEGYHIPNLIDLTELRENSYFRFVTSYGGASVKGWVAFKVKDNSHKGKVTRTGVTQSFDSEYSYMQPHIFLPYNGYGEGTSLKSGETTSGASLGFYWLSTNSPNSFGFTDNDIPTKGSRNRHLALGVRAVKSPAPFKPKFIDLGLASGTLWCEANLNAKSVTDFGLYYQFGSLEGYSGDAAKAHSTWTTAPFNGGNSNYDQTSWNAQKNLAISDGELRPEYDAAYQHTGGVAKIPTKAQIEELCTLPNEWVANYQGTGVPGRLFHGSKGTTLFLPAAGCYYDSDAHYIGNNGVQIWSSTVYRDNQAQATYLFAWDNNVAGSDNKPRYYSYPIRPVMDAPVSLEVTGEVRTNYNVTNGPKEYKVKSGSPWKLQYTLDDGANWVDAKAGQTIDGWISFDKVSGIASDQAVSVKATVAPATVQTSITVNHNDNLRNASYRGQNSEVASQQRPYDLSTHDIYGNPTQCNTANCYVISGPGLYAFPLVYGNAIKNGADNKQAYAPSAASSSATYLTPFKSASGDITSPYIDGVASAAPLWEDVAGWALVGENDCKVLSPSQAAAKGLTAGCGYVMFEVKAANLTPGNAVIAVKNSGGTILWSWHLWVTDLDLACMTVTNHDGSFNKGMMPINLGWVDADASATYDGYAGKRIQVRFFVSNDNTINKVAERKPSDGQLHNNGSSPMWQWGRKDPLLKGKYQTMAGPLDVASSIAYPSSFIYSTTSISWLNKNYYNLWNAISTSKGDLSSSPVKTIYDPCPSGFKVPQGNAFTGFTSTGENSTSFDEWNVPTGETDVEAVPGHHFYTSGWKTGETIFFPVNYWIKPDTGEFVETKIINVWTATASSGENASYYFSAKKNNPSNSVSPVDFNGRANGGAIRPVRE